MTSQRTIFTAPPVLPALPPRKRATNSTIFPGWLHWLKSMLAYPVVVTMEAAWNAA